MQATMLLFSTWILAFFLIGQTKNIILSLELRSHLRVKYETACLLYNKILRAMADREEDYLFQRNLNMDDVYLGGEYPSGRVGWGSDNKIPLDVASSLNEAGHPIYTRITPVKQSLTWPNATLCMEAICLQMVWPASSP